MTRSDLVKNALDTGLAQSPKIPDLRDRGNTAPADAKPAGSRPGGARLAIITLTQAASRRLATIVRAAREANPSVSDPIVLLAVVKGGCAGAEYRMSTVAAGDLGRFATIVEGADPDGKVAIDPASEMMLMGMTVDFTSSAMESKFVFTNPNEKQRCGCGESISL